MISGAGKRYEISLSQISHPNPNLSTLIFHYKYNEPPISFKHDILPDSGKNQRVLWRCPGQCSAVTSDRRSSILSNHLLDSRFKVLGSRF